jgi:hypothetical protein
MSEKKEKETKIMRPVFSYPDKIADAGINLRECKEPPRRAVKRFIRFAEAVDDVRVSGMVTYPLLALPDDNAVAEALAGTGKK